MCIFLIVLSSSVMKVIECSHKHIDESLLCRVDMFQVYLQSM